LCILAAIITPGTPEADQPIAALEAVHEHTPG
jgi:hypothetical protein